MHSELIKDAFRKAEDNLRKQDGNDPSNRQMAMELSNFLTDDCGFPFGERRLRDYFNAVHNFEDVNITQKEVIKGLCNYLGFDTYQEYSNSKLSEFKNQSNVPKKRSNDPKNKRNRFILISIGAVVLMGLVLLLVPTQEKCMVWKEDHYEEVEFDIEKLANGSYKLYKEDRIQNFRLINNVDCNYAFFNADESVKVWYGKNTNGVLEYFTDLGLHPETGKTLRPITTYMIKTHICANYR